MASEKASAQAGSGPAPEPLELEQNVTEAAPPPVDLEELEAQEQEQDSASMAPEPAADEMGLLPADDEAAAHAAEAPAPSELLAEIGDGGSSDDPPAPTLGPAPSTMSRCLRNRDEPRSCQRPACRSMLNTPSTATASYCEI